MNIKQAKHLLAVNMKAYRKKLKLSQEDLAKKVGIHRTYIGGIEQEKRNPSLKNIVKIANNLEVEIKDLFREREINL